MGDISPVSSGGDTISSVLSTNAQPQQYKLIHIASNTKMLLFIFTAYAPFYRYLYIMNYITIWFKIKDIFTRISNKIVASDTILLYH